MRLLFAGTPAAALPSLELLIKDPEHDVVAVLTRPAAPSGRGRTMHDSPVAELARAAGIEVLSPPTPSDAELLEYLAGLQIDCAPVVAYGALLRAPALAIPRHGWVNLHFSLLPAWRGAAPVQHAVLHGDDITGASTFLIGPGLDDGPVYGVVTESIRPTDTSGDLLQRLSESGARLLLATMHGIAAGSLRAQPQSSDGVSVAPKLHSEDARVSFQAAALSIDRRIRACTPAPGAWLEFRGERMKLGPIVLASPEDQVRLPPGQVQVISDHVLVGTPTGNVQLGWVQQAGKKPMPAHQWARGARLGDGDRFG